MSSDAHTEQPAVFLLTWPRTASHLFEKVFSLQPGVELIEHPAMKQQLVPQESIMYKFQNKTIEQSDREDLKAIYQSGWEKTLDRLDQARSKGQRPLVHEHLLFMLDVDLCRTHMKPTPGAIPPVDDFWTPVDPGESEASERTGTLLYPDNFVTEKMVPVIPIRNPALSFPSIFRAATQVEGVARNNPLFQKWLTLGPVRQTYDWLVANSKPECQPVLVEADDLMTEGPERDEIMDKVYEHIGFEHPPQWTWKQKSDQTLRAQGVNEVPLKIKESIYKSTGIVKGKSSKDLDMDEAYNSWVDEFGEDSARMIWGKVQQSMDDYEYLTARKVSVD